MLYSCIVAASFKPLAVLQGEARELIASLFVTLRRIVGGCFEDAAKPCEKFMVEFLVLV
jgi:hypothetical protein